MSNGLGTLLQAAQYIEQQEQLKLSPISNEQQQHRLLPHGSYDALSINGLANNSGSNHNNSNNNNTNIHINARNSNGRHLNNHHNNQQSNNHQQYHVSSSAPAAGATFQHTNGLTITATSANIANGSTIGNGSSQLTTAITNPHRRNGCIDFDFSGNGNIAGSLGNGVTIIATAASAAAAASTAAAGGGSTSNSSLSPLSSPIAAVTSNNGRSSEGRMSEDEISSTPSPISHNKSPTFLLLAASHQTSIQNEEKEQKQIHEQQQHHQHILQQQQHQHNENNLKLKSFTLVDGNTRNVAGVVANKQMLLNGGIRIASPAASTTTVPILNGTIDVSSSNSPRLMSITQQQQHHHHTHQIFANKQLLATSSPSTFSLHGSMSRHKSGIPLTPPPNASRKLSEPYSQRIRSHSMSSHKISALLHNGGNSNSSNSNSSNHMIVDDAPHLSNSNHSPPRHGGSHYMQIMSGSQGSSHPHYAHCGRRRTISSNSNGAGTREVHNILEKNRRAHLKGCYDELKIELSLNDEERSKKTSNLAVLNEAIKTVRSLQSQEKENETEIEQLAKEKIILQKRIVNLKRELGPKCEQFFPDSELGSIPSERDNVHDSASLSSGRGSTLYSSSSSLSSGGSSNIMFSPVGAGLTTATPTAISPVIAKMNNNNNNSNNNNTTAGITNLHNNSISTTTTATLSLTDSPNNGLPLMTRGSPTPSTPSPSPSSSSGISSSCSLISSSPPMSGIINNGRSVTVNIPFHQGNSGGATIGTIGNGNASAAATIIATTPPSGNSNNTVRNNAGGHSSQMINVTTSATNISTAPLTTSTNNSNNINGYRRKTSLSISDDGKATLTTTTIKDFEDASQQPAAKCIKVFNGLVTKEQHLNSTAIAAATTTVAPAASLQLSQVVGGGSLVVSPSFFNAVANTNDTLRTQKLLMNGQNVGGPNGGALKNIIINGTTTTTTNELGRLPGGAELNILPSNGIVKSINGIISSASASTTATTTAAASAAATTFYHANGKLTLVNGGAAVGVGVGGNSSILLKDSTNALGVTSTAAITPIIVSSAQSSTMNGLNAINSSTSFAQLLAATSVAPPNLATLKNVAPVERLNGKLRLSVGAGQERQQINATQHIGNMKPMIVTMATTTSATQPIQTNTQNSINTTGAALLYNNYNKHKHKTYATIQEQQQQQHAPVTATRSQLQQLDKNAIIFQHQHQQQHHHHYQQSQSTIPLFKTKTKRTAPPITPTTSFLTTKTTATLSSIRR